MKAVLRTVTPAKVNSRIREGPCMIAVAAQRMYVRAQVEREVHIREDST